MSAPLAVLLVVFAVLALSVVGDELAKRRNRRASDSLRNRNRIGWP